MTASTTAKHTVDQLPVSRLTDGHELSLVVHRLTGSTDGPRLILLGGVHGDEPIGVEIARRAVESLSGLDFAGEVVVLPVCNPLALHALNRNSPLDGGNLNRVMPGDAGGTITDRIGAVLADFLRGSGGTHLIDLHSGGNQATVDYVYLDTDGPEVATAFGSPLLYDHNPYQGTTTDVAKAAGMKVMVSELGGGGQRIDHYVSRGVTGVLNVMRRIGMLPGEPEPPLAPQRIVHEISKLGPVQGGFLISEYGAERLGQEVPEGTVLGRVYDPYTFELLEELRAPYPSNILVLAREPMTVVAPGDFAFMVANATTATEL